MAVCVGGGLVVGPVWAGVQAAAVEVEVVETTVVVVVEAVMSAGVG